MDNVKIGALIAAVRKERGLTQKELGKRLHVSDRAVSKWERGLNLPDAALFEPLCRELDISVTELLRGERQEATVPQLEQVVSDTVALAGRKERTIKWLKRLAIVLLCVLGVIGKLWWDYAQDQKELQRQRDWDYSFPEVSFQYSAGQGRIEELHIYVMGHYGPFKAAWGEKNRVWTEEDMSGSTLCIQRGIGGSLPPKRIDMSDKDSSDYIKFQLSYSKTDMEIQVMRWPLDMLETDAGFEDGEQVSFKRLDEPGLAYRVPYYNGPVGRFYIEPGYVYSVLIFWGDGFYAEYPFYTV